MPENTPRPWETKPDFNNPASALESIAKYQLLFRRVLLKPGVADADQSGLFGTTDHNYQTSKLRPPLAAGLSFELQVMAKIFPLEEVDRQRLLECVKKIEKIGEHRELVVKLDKPQEEIDRLLISAGPEQESAVDEAANTALEVLSRLEQKYTTPA